MEIPAWMKRLLGLGEDADEKAVVEKFGQLGQATPPEGGQGLGRSKDRPLLDSLPHGTTGEGNEPPEGGQAGSPPDGKERADQLADVEAKLTKAEETIAQQQQALATMAEERLQERVGALLGELRSTGYLTPDQAEAARPLAVHLARSTDQLGEGESKLSALDAWAKQVRDRGPVVQLGAEVTRETPDEEKERKERAKLAAEAAGAKVEE